MPYVNHSKHRRKLTNSKDNKDKKKERHLQGATNHGVVGAGAQLADHIRSMLGGEVAHQPPRPRRPPF